MSLKEFTTGQNFISTELFCDLERHTYISTFNQTEMVVECNPWCVLEQDTYISTCNQTETVVECNPWCVLEGDTQISTCNQTKSVGEGNPYAQINLNMSSITAQMITYVSYCTYLYHNKIMSYKVMLLHVNIMFGVSRNQLTKTTQLDMALAILFSLFY